MMAGGLAVACLSWLAAGGMLECQVCYCEVGSHEASAAACGHFFCNECWGAYIKMQVSAGTTTRCPSPQDHG